MKMEQEHMIIVGLLVVIAVLSYYTFKECESCKKANTEGFGLDLPIDASAHIRMREGYGIPGDANEAATAAHIRMREGFGIPGDANEAATAAHIRNNMNNSYQHSSHVTHHLRRDHRNKMMRNMMFGQ
jgi:hypothetical protein